jgi:hypothetical protein
MMTPNKEFAMSARVQKVMDAVDASPKPNLESAVCRNFLKLIGKPSDLQKIRATETVKDKWRVCVYRNNTITDTALVKIDGNVEIIAHFPDRKGQILSKKY